MPSFVLPTEAFNSPAHALAFMRRLQPEAMSLEPGTLRPLLLNRVLWNPAFARGITYLSERGLLDGTRSGDYVVLDVPSR